MALRSIIAALTSVLLTLGATAQEPAVPAPVEPLKADPAADIFMAAQIWYQEAIDAKDPKMAKENFEAAVRQFSRFLQFHRGHKDTIRAWYYSAVCYQKLGQKDAARRCLNAVVEDGRTGPLVGSAAYQLASHHYIDEKWAAAEPLYAIAAKEAQDEATRQNSLYRRALCFQKLDQPLKTIKVLEVVLADPASPFRSRAETALAHYYKEHDRPKDALALFEKLAASTNAKTRADAILQAALLARDLDDAPRAESYFEKILTTPGLDQWRGEAQLALMSSASLRQDSKRVIDLYRRGKFKLKKGQQASRVRLAIQAYETLGNKDATTPLYQELQRLDPGGTTAFEAAYILLARAYPDRKKDFSRKAEDFLQRHGKAHADDARTHSARLMLAEALFQNKQHAKAATAYSSIDLKHIKPENHLGIRYRLATARLEAGDLPGSIIATNDFLANHANDARVPNILAKRADALLANGDTDKALKDFEHLLTSATDPVLKEYAWAQKAGIHKNRKEYPELIECHRHLLADLPDRDATKHAGSHFWIGWALFHSGKFAECVPHFQKARDGDPKSLSRECTLHLALSHYTLQQKPELQGELDRLLVENPKAKIPRNIFAWLGVKIATEDEDLEKAWRYLPRAIDVHSPDDTKTIVWRSHARAAVATGNFRDAIPSLEILLERDDNAILRARSHYLLAKAHFGLNALKEARAAAEEALALKPQGTLNAEIRLILGDVALAEDDPKKAAQDYVVVVELFGKDPEVLKAALRRASAALGDLGDPQSLKDARRYREQLKALENRPPPPPGG